MTKIMVLGHGPLPFENESKLFGPGIRTWQFAKPLIGDGHEVTVVCSRIPFVYADSLPPILETERDGGRLFSVAQAVFEDGSFLQHVHDSFEPDCIVAATVFPSYVASRIRTARPIWVDLFGDTMAEAQAKAFTYSDDSHLAHFWNFVRTALDRGDVFSAVSEPQKYALIGQLGSRGRLNRHSHGYDFAWTIPCAIEVTEPRRSKTVLRGIRVRDEDFVVLWSGGYNTWTDVDTLFQGLEKAMSTNERITFASTGGQIDGHDEMTYPRFLRMIEGSPFQDRFVMAGWVPMDDVVNYSLESDVGINIDAPNYEAVLGSRNRLLQWMNVGLPTLTTETSEITHLIRAERLGYVFGHGDADLLSRAILELAEDPDGLRSTAERAREYVRGRWTFEVTTEPLRRWARRPNRAPDRGRGVRLDAPANQSSFPVAVDPTRAASRARPAGASVTFASVIVISYNSRDDLRECLEALSASEGCAFEIVVVDNASIDGSAELARAISPRATIVRSQRNLGFGGAVNAVYRRCRGDVIAIVNPDATVRPDWLRTLMDALRENPDVGIVGSKLLYPDGTTIQHGGGSISYPLSLPNHFGYGERDQGQCDEPRDVDYVTGAAFAIRKSVLEEVGSFDEGFFPAYFEEADLCYRARRAGYRVRYEPCAVAIHRESVTTGKDSAVYFSLFHRNRMRFILKHYSEEQLWRDFLPAELERLRGLGDGVESAALQQAYVDNLAVVDRSADGPSGSGACRDIPAGGRRSDLLKALLGRSDVAPGSEKVSRARIREQIAALGARSQIVEPPFVSGAPVVGPLIVRFRYLWNWVSTKWFIRPIIQQQSEFNAAVVGILSELAERDGISSAAEPRDHP